MTLRDLVERLEGRENGSHGLLMLWLDELDAFTEYNYHKIYGFIRGLAALDFITPIEEQELLDCLLIVAYDERLV